MLTPSLYPSAWMRLAARRRRAIAVTLVAVTVMGILVPAGISEEQHTVVTGHSTFFNGDAHDPCLAAIVGIMRYKVLWFNDMTLVERYNGDGTYLYVTEDGAENPTTQTLKHSGIFYDFVDPNGVAWHVDEAYWDVELATVDKKDEDRPIAEVDDSPPSYYVNAEVKTNRYYTWIVAVDKPHRDNFAGDDPHTFYNFVTLVNTCKFHPDNRNNTFLGPEEHLEKDNTVNNGHEKFTGNHTHETYEVGLWVGGPPAILPVGTETPNYANGTASGSGDYGNSPPGGGYLPP